MARKKTNEVEVIEAEVVEEEKVYTPAEYFEMIKGKMEEQTSENVKNLYNLTMNKLQKYIVTGQKNAAKDLYAKCLSLTKEMQLLETGKVSKYIPLKEIDNYIDNVADKCVVVVELRNYDRVIPDELIDVVIATKDIFDEFYVVFTDYTGEKRSKVEQAKRDKDPILFGNIFVDGRISDKMYFIGDWVDEYCDLTLDKMIEEIAKKNKEAGIETDIVYDIKDLSILENASEALFGKALKANSMG